MLSHYWEMLKLKMETVETYIKNRVGFIILNRPKKRNALNAELVLSLIKAFKEFEGNDAVKVIVLRANGKVFCAGADLAYLQQLQKNTFEENLEDSNQLKKLFLTIYKLKKVVIAQVHGHAIAGGCGLATVCDFIFTVPEAKFGYTEVKIGFIPAIVKIFLIRKVGEAKAKELLLIGDLISAEQAMQMNMVNYLVAAEKLEEEVEVFARKLCTQNSEQSMQRTKQMIADIRSMDFESALDYAAEMNAKARESEDCKKGIAAFLNKEKLAW